MYIFIKSSLVCWLVRFELECGMEEQICNPTLPTETYVFIVIRAALGAKGESRAQADFIFILQQLQLGLKNDRLH